MASTKKHLLVIGGPSAAGYVKDVLKYYGFRVQTVATWELAQALLGEQTCDMLIFAEARNEHDLDAPLAELRAQNREVPVLIMGDLTLSEVGNNSTAIGHIEVINKQISPSTLKQRVEAALQQTRPVRVMPPKRKTPFNPLPILQAG